MRSKIRLGILLFLLIPGTTHVQASPNLTNTVEPFLIEKKQEAPNFDTEVIKPLQAAQEAAKKALEPPPVVYTAPVLIAPPTGAVQAVIIKWANYYGVSANWLLRVANCESGFNQSATNYNYYAGGGNPHGIFQFLPQTFYGNGGTNYDSYDDQARVAAYMFSIGQSGQWSCK